MPMLPVASHAESPSPLAEVQLFSSTSTLAALLINASILEINCGTKPRPAIHVAESALAPAALKPTLLQVSVPHMPYVALLPFASFRDNLLRARDRLSAVEFWTDVVQNVRVWGRTPWDRRGWEVQEWFAVKWHWLMTEEVLEETNFWRVSQGLDPLQLMSGLGAVAV